MKDKNNQIKFNIFSFISTFARSLIEVFISIYLFKNGYDIKQILLFYFLVNILAIPIAYLYVKIGEKTKYIYVMIIGIIGFILVQILLQNVIIKTSYLFLLALLYSIYRRGYWVARRYFITKVMPSKKSSGLFSIVLVLTQISTILASYVGANILDNESIGNLMLISSILLVISIIPLIKIEDKEKSKEIKLIENLKKYDKKNYIVFTMYELNNLLSFIFPIYLAIYVKNSYKLVGNLNIISNIAIILFVLVFGKLLKKDKNYITISTILVVICSILKLGIGNSLIMYVYFIEGIVLKLQNQAVNKQYFENRNNMDLTHYNLIYQVIESIIRALTIVVIIFMNNITTMIITVVIIITILLITYIINNKKESE